MACVSLLASFFELAGTGNLITTLCYDIQEHANFYLPPKTLSEVCLYNKQNNTWLLVDMEYLFLFSTLYLTYLLCSLVRYQVEHLKRYSISTHAHVISYIFLSDSGIFQNNKKKILFTMHNMSTPKYILLA